MKSEISSTRKERASDRHSQSLANPAETSWAHLIGASSMWLLTSMLLTMVLKAILDPAVLGFNFPLTVTTISLSTTSIFLFALQPAPEGLWSGARTKDLLCRVALPLGLGTALEVGTCNLAYPMLSISLMSVLKCATVVTTYIAGIVVGVEKLRGHLLFIVFTIIVGISLAARDLYFQEWMGLFWMTLSTLAFTWKALTAQKIQASVRGLSPRDLSYLVMPSAALWFLPFVMAAELGPLMSWTPPAGAEPGRIARIVALVATVPCLGYINMVSLFAVIRAGSSLTMAVLIDLKQVLAIAGGIMLFGDHWTLRGVSGLVIALAAMVEYARIRANNQSTISNNFKSKAECREMGHDTEASPLLKSMDEERGDDGDPSA